MTSLVNKIWQLGGIFYLSLIVSIACFSLLSKKIKAHLFLAIMVAAIAFSTYSTAKEVINRRPSFAIFFKSPEEKIASYTFGQNAFAANLKKVLPAQAKGCIYWSWDIPTRWLIQELYPRTFIPVKPEYPLQQCDYIISQFKPNEALANFKQWNFGENYLYKIKN